MNKDTADLFDKMNTRFDDIEKLLQLLLVNNLINDVEQITKIIEDNITSELQSIMDKYGVKSLGFRAINDIEVLTVEIPINEKLKSKDLSLICSEIRSYYPTKEPLLIFKSINGMQRKRILQEGISFGVQGKELHISNRGIRK